MKRVGAIFLLLQLRLASQFYAAATRFCTYLFTTALIVRRHNAPSPLCKPNKFSLSQAT